MSFIKSWYPARLRICQNELCCDWIQLEDTPFTEPFFDETLAKARSKSMNSNRFHSISSADVLADWSRSLPYVQPTAFIFHISRCGSTLLSQLLGLHPRSISLSEVPFFDDLIRLPFKVDAPSSFNVSETLAAAIRLYGQKRTGREQYLFIKLDSWHIFFWRQLRTLYPKVPFVLLYRRPDEVMRSHRKLRGMQAVPGIIEPDVFGFHPEEVHTADLDGYLARVLERYFDVYLDVASEDHLTKLLNYDQGPMALLYSVALNCEVPLDDAYLANVAERSTFHSKDPTRVFSEERAHQDTSSRLTAVFRLYDRLEQLRLQTKKEASFS